MDFHEDILSVYRRKRKPRLVWQPRLEHWYKINQREGTLPERYRHATLRDIYDDLGASVRYFWSAEGFHTVHSSGVSVTREERDGCWYTRWETHLGELSRIEKITQDSWMTTKYPVQSLDDLRVMEYVLDSSEHEFDSEVYERSLAELDERTAPTTIFPRVNLQRIFIDFIGYEEAIYLLYDHPREMERLIRAVDRSDDRLAEVVKKSPFDIVNFGDNVHSDMLPPPLFERYVLSRYQALSELFHCAEKYTFPHWDGNVKPLMPYAMCSGFDGIEAVTFEPQGDISIENAKEEMRELILIDGIPAIFFLPDWPIGTLEQCTRKVIETFYPNLILGISDELPPAGDIERCRLVSEIVAEYNDLYVASTF